MADFSLEQPYWNQGIRWVAGVDEAGRGPLAGPVVAAAVVFPIYAPELQALKGLTDSKQLSEKARCRFVPLIQELALDYAVGIVSAPVIDRINILQATYLAMRRAIVGLTQVDQVLVDGNRCVPFLDTPQATIIKGDALSVSIAAASVLAKVVRDGIMEALEQHYPGYGFAQHKGYGTAAHCRQISALGLSPQHRRQFCQKIQVSS